MAPDMQRRNRIAITLATASLVIVCCLVHGSSQQKDKLKGATRQLYNNASKCGNQNDIARRVGICSKPVLDILEGNLEKWPRTTTDMEDICGQIQGAEKCDREEGRNCAQGLHKTIVSTVANSVQRARKRECAKAMLPNLLKLVNCIEKQPQDTRRLIAGIVTRLQVIEAQIDDPIKRRNAVCCTISDMEAELKTLFDRICPSNESETIVRLYKSVLQDVVNLICQSPKCVDVFKGYTIPKTVTEKNGIYIAILLRLIFSLTNE